MPDAEVYTIKEMIEEFRNDVKSSFKSVNDRLDKIDDKQAKANGRTGKLEMRQYMMLGAFAVLMAIGALFAKLYVQDIARKTSTVTAQMVVQSLYNDYQTKINGKTVNK